MDRADVFHRIAVLGVVDVVEVHLVLLAHGSSDSTLEASRPDSRNQRQGQNFVARYPK